MNLSSLWAEPQHVIYAQRNPELIRTAMEKTDISYETLTTAIRRQKKTATQCLTILCDIESRIRSNSHLEAEIGYFRAIAGDSVFSLLLEYVKSYRYEFSLRNIN